MAVRHWSQGVTAHSNALDLEQDVFKKHDPHEIALSLKHSAEHSKRRKGTAFQSAMSMLTFYINRAGRDLDEKQRKVLERAKDELRTLFGKEPTRSKVS
jgi:translation initiation factor 2 alpha subunit (eIF-2alpha)